MTLKPVARADIYAVWPFVREGLLKVAAKCKERYRPEDVFLTLHTTDTALFMIEDRGFLIACTRRDPDGLALFVWILWGEGLAPIEDEIHAELDKLAKATGCRRIRWESPRNWAGRGKVVRHVYEREL